MNRKEPVRKPETGDRDPRRQNRGELIRRRTIAVLLLLFLLAGGYYIRTEAGSTPDYAAEQEEPAVLPQELTLPVVRLRTSAGAVPNTPERIDEVWPAHITITDAEGLVLADQDVGYYALYDSPVRTDEVSLRILADAVYDPGHNKITLSFPGWKNAFAPFSNVRKYKNFVLHAAGQDGLLYDGSDIRDAVFSRILHESGFDGYVDTQRVLLYIDGTFAGIRNLKQDLSRSFLAARYRNPEPATIERCTGGSGDVLRENGIVYGLFTGDLSDAFVRESLEALVDMDQYLMYVAVNYLSDNASFPVMGSGMWRTVEPEEGYAYGDGRYRFLSAEGDGIWRKRPADGFQPVVMQDAAVQNVLSCEEYRQRFVSLVKELRGGAFSDAAVERVIREALSTVQPYTRFYYGNEAADKQEKAAEALTENAHFFLRQATLAIGEEAAAGDGAQAAAEEPADAEEPAEAEERTEESGGAPLLPGKTLLISEVAAEGPFDWFRITNAGEETVRTGAYSISDDPGDPGRYMLPDVALSPGQSLIINGKRNYAAIGDYICNFALRQGETLTLYLEGGVIDALTIPPIEEGETFGYAPDFSMTGYYDNTDDKRKKE